jgi:hypothetical protein
VPLRLAGEGKAPYICNIVLTIIAFFPAGKQAKWPSHPTLLIILIQIKR